MKLLDMQTDPQKVIVGAFGEYLEYTLYEAKTKTRPNPPPMDITGLTPTIYVILLEDPTVHFTGVMEVEDAATGKVRYKIKVGDFPVAGEYVSEIHLDDGLETLHPIVPGSRINCYDSIASQFEGGV